MLISHPTLAPKLLATLFRLRHIHKLCLLKVQVILQNQNQMTVFLDRNPGLLFFPC